MTRPSRDEYGLQLARTVALRADCTRRQVGAVIISPDGSVVSTGYNGRASGLPGCLTDGACPRGQMTYAEQPAGVGYAETSCDAAHAEVNAVIRAGRDRAVGATIYVTDEPCHGCSVLIAAAGISRVVHGGDSGIRPEALGTAPVPTSGPLDLELVAALQRAKVRQAQREAEDAIKDATPERRT